MTYTVMVMDKIGDKRNLGSTQLKHFIREWMKKRGLKQAAIAARMDVEQATISKLLRGVMRMSDVWLIGFAEALDVEVGDLFRDPNRPTQEELLAGLTEDDTDTVVQLITHLREKRQAYEG